MSKLRIITCATLACAVLATPVLAQQKRKTLLQVLFPKAHERQLERARIRREALQRNALKKIVRVPRTVYYTYKVAKRAPIVLTPLAVEYASVGAISKGNDHPTLSDGPSTPDKKIERSALTEDLLLAEKQRMSAEE